MTNSYTESLNEHIRESVRRIGSGKVDRFRSEVFSMTGDDTHIEWREAARDPVSQTWMVTRYSGWLSFKADGGVRDLNTKCEYGLCFFDALHEVAAFDAQKIMQSLKPLEPLPAFIHSSHHRAQVEGVGIPYDADGLPLPAVNGMIVAPGNYDAQMLMIAQKSLGNVDPEKASIPVASAITRGLPVPAMPGAGQGASQNMVIPNILRQKQNLDKQRGVLSDQVDAMTDRLDHGPVTPSGAVYSVLTPALGGAGAVSIPMLMAGGGSVTAGAILLSFSIVGGFFATAAYYIHEFNGRYPAIDFARKRGQLKKLAHSFPEGSELRADLERFHDEIVLAYHVSKACDAFHAAATGDSKLWNWNFDRALKKMDKVCRKMGMSDMELQALHQQLYRNASSLKNDMVRLVRDRGNSLSSKLNVEVLAAAKIREGHVLPAHKALPGPSALQ